MVLTVLTVVTVIGSCKKDFNSEFELSRNFSSNGFTITQRETNVEINWNRSPFSTGKLTYTIEISKTQTFQTIDFTATVDTTVVTVNNTQIAVRQPYWVRVKALANGSQAESKWNTSTATFMILGEQFFLPIGANDLIDNAVILRWRTTPGLTKITLAQGTNPAVDYPLDATDLANTFKQINGLTPNTAYTAQLYAGTLFKGILTFTTRAALAGSVIDLRGITGVPTILADTIPDVAAGSIVVLKKGQTYTIPASMDIPRTITIMPGFDFSNAETKIFMGGAAGNATSFNIPAASNIDSIVFKDLTLYSDGYGAKYVFNISRQCNINKIKFDNCKAEIFRGVCRLQTAAVILKDYIVNNCIMDSLSNYGVLTVDNVLCKVDNITLTNSTFWKAERIIVSRSNSVSIKIDNCTFNEAPSGNSYFINYLDGSTLNKVTAGITMTNCILGIGKTTTTSSVRTVRGIRADASITASNNYKTSDFTYVPIPDPNPNGEPFPIPTLLNYAGTSEQLWQSPYTGNFKIIDNSFAGRNTAGDPRWRP
jgi:hypothetical protein